MLFPYCKFKPLLIHSCFRRIQLASCFNNRILYNHRVSVSSLIESYKQFGYIEADYNPLISKQLQQLSTIPELSPKFHNINENEEISKHYESSLQEVRAENSQTVEDLIESLRKLFCGKLSIQCDHIKSIDERNWLYAEFIKSLYTEFSNDDQLKFLHVLLKSTLFDKFMAIKFPTVKRYGCEGCETSMIFYSHILQQAACYNILEIVFGMAHRGRLNFLSDSLNYQSKRIFRKIKGYSEFSNSDLNFGDVLSHLNARTTYRHMDKSLDVMLLSNPSHLEAINPVAMGYCKARLKSRGSSSTDRPPPVLCVQVHGDASMAAQGIVAESLALTHLEGFSIGGSVHLVINNQLGFTTPASQAKSWQHSTDVAKLLDSPVLRVNGQCPESVARAAALAVKYRNRFAKDIFVDLVCYRRRGHNELDDPTLTQPLMYERITSMGELYKLYASHLRQHNVVTDDTVAAMERRYVTHLTEELAGCESVLIPAPAPINDQWRQVQRPRRDVVSIWDTGVQTDTLRHLCEISLTVPGDFHVHDTVRKVLLGARRRRVMQEEGEDGGGRLDWATCETLALASLLADGHDVRLCGQDVARGTFSQRHASLVDCGTERAFVPLQHLQSRLGRSAGHFDVVNSPLSEEAVLGFEYGHSIESPHRLCVWEAQFGDFFNGAQIIIDTMLSCGQLKWNYACGLVLLLPHGLDGAGPEHSSCRLERFLQLSDSSETACDGDCANMHIVYPTLPAQLFHLLRLQLARDYRLPVICAAPKLLLRHAACTSSISQLQPGTHWRCVIDDPQCAVRRASVRRLIFCAGKHYFDLSAYRERSSTDCGLRRCAIVRLEQLCPFPATEIGHLIREYPAAREFVWSQEEHRNQGAWSFVRPRFSAILGVELTYSGRGVSAVPATGVGRLHQSEASDVIRAAFTV